MRARWIVAGVVAAIVLLPMVFVAGIFVLHPRSENQFIGELHNDTLPEVWTSFVDQHDEGFLIDEGDRACRWLSDQPFALFSNARRYQLASLMERYLAETQEDPGWDFDGRFSPRRLVAAAAWSHLCEATVLVHRPIHPWGNSDLDPRD
jgi:hypothetical protein